MESLDSNLNNNNKKEGNNLFLPAFRFIFALDYWTTYTANRVHCECEKFVSVLNSDFLERILNDAFCAV